ncbi:MAG: rRNA maturation RNase YbeY [Ferruginibacter sp.]|nr:rRNA maturation RNase YbeY [Ferruginibacter sp.]
MISITFNYLDASSNHFNNKTKLKAQLLSLFKKEKTALQSLNYVFCTDEYLLGINQQFLNHNYYTDIITFNLASKNQPVIGDIYISIDRVKDNATTHKTSFKEEIHRVIFHGALHLCGYKDKSAKDSAEMRKMEDKYLHLYFKQFHK